MTPEPKLVYFNNYPCALHKLLSHVTAFRSCRFASWFNIGCLGLPSTVATNVHVLPIGRTENTSALPLL